MGVWDSEKVMLPLGCDRWGDVPNVHSAQGWASGKNVENRDGSKSLCVPGM